jgi:hypothetical protein
MAYMKDSTGRRLDSFEVASKMFINLKDYNPTGGGANDTSAFTAAIDAAVAKRTAKGGPLSTVQVYVPTDFYRVTNLVIPTGINLWCDGTIIGPTSGSTGAMLTFPGSYSGIQGAYLAGGGLIAPNQSAIATTSASFHTNIKDCHFDNWSGRAIYDAPSAIGTYIDNNFAQNCLLDVDALTAYTGVVELAGTDAWFDKSEITASRYSGRGMSTGKWACAIAITGANNMVRQIVAETSDHGVYVGVGASQLDMAGVRGELCYGNGFIFAGGSGRLSNCHALRNSQAGNNLYSGFVTTGPTNFITTALYSESGGAHPKQAYGVLDTYGQNASHSEWDVKSVGDNAARGTSNAGANSFVIRDNAPTNMDSGTTQPYGAWRNILANNTAPQNVTSFSQTVNGQRITIRGDGFTTLVNGSFIKTTSGANMLLAANTWYHFLVVGGVLTQV